MSAPRLCIPVIDSLLARALVMSAWVGAPLIYFYYRYCRSNGNTHVGPAIMMIVTSVVET